MLPLPEITDPAFDPSEKFRWYEKLFLYLIEDPRDMPFIRLCLYIQLVLFPLFVLLYLPVFASWSWWLMVLIYTVCWMAAGFSFTLMLHDTSHLRFFKRKYQWANYLIPWIYSPMFGQTPGTFFQHHIGMHHTENNQWSDLSSTMPYQRDSFADFMKYFLRFFFFAIPDLSVYFFRRNRPDKAWQAIGGEIAFWSLFTLAALISLKAAVVTLLAPFIVVRFSLMAGNWAQHAFVDPDDPGNPYLNCITCINTIYNRVCYNDGYHTGHHSGPHRHWTDMPADFLKNREKYVAHRSVIFHNLHYFQIWALLMLKRHDVLGAHLVNLDGMFASEEEALQLIKRRLRKTRGLVNPKSPSSPPKQSAISR